MLKYVFQYVFIWSLRLSISLIPKLLGFTGFLLGLVSHLLVRTQIWRILYEAVDCILESVVHQTRLVISICWNADFG